MGSDKFKNKDFSMDMNRYLDKKSKASNRFLNLHDHIKGTKTVSVDTNTEIVHIKSTTPFGHFLNRIKSFFSPEDKREEEDIDAEEVEELVNKAEEDEIPESDDGVDEEDGSDETIHKKPSFWSRFVAMFGSDSKAGDEDEDEYDEDFSEEDEMKADMKIIAIFAKKVLKKVPRDEFEELKDSGDLDEFKSILRKYRIIK